MTKNDSQIHNNIYILNIDYDTNIKDSKNEDNKIKKKIII